MPRSRVAVWSRLRLARGPVSSTTVPASMSSCTLATTSRAPDLLHHRVAEREHLGEVVPGVDVHHRERHPGGRERLHGQVEHDDRVLAAREQQHRPLELGRHLTDDVDRLRLEGPQVRQLVGRRGHGGITVNPDQTGKQSHVPSSPPPPTTRWRRRAATEAGRAAGGAPRGADRPAGYHPSLMGDVGDRQAHLFLLDLLAREAPGDAVLSEEGRDDLRRLDAERVWIIDPVDGTREFSEPGRTDWAVHVALAIDGVAVAGAVALPARGHHPHHRPAAAGPARRTTARSASSCRGPVRRTRRG